MSPNMPLLTCHSMPEPVATADHLRLATWNINSLRLRLETLQRFAELWQPDIIALQETKVPDALFPTDAIQRMGYAHLAYVGEKSYNGVAILSRVPFLEQRIHQWVGSSARHVGVLLSNGWWLDNVYVPAGGDIPDPAVNPKFRDKLAYMDQLRLWSMASSRSSAPSILVGDLNIAPHPQDVWSHRQLRRVVSHTDEEIASLQALQDTQSWIDVGRHFIPLHEKLYSWWSYRNHDWRRSNRGRRLDHIWVTPSLAPALQRHFVAVDVRDWPFPSDHVPVLVDISHTNFTMK